MHAFMLQGGRGRAGAGRRGEDGDLIYKYEYIKGGRDRAGAGRRGEDGEFIRVIYT